MHCGGGGGERWWRRGLEFSSYAFPTGREANVEMGKLFDTPTFEWLDAHQTKSTCFYMSVQATDKDLCVPIDMTLQETDSAPALVADHLVPIVLF